MHNDNYNIDYLLFQSEFVDSEVILGLSVDEVPIVGDWDMTTPGPSIPSSEDVKPTHLPSPIPNEERPPEKSISKGQKRKRIIEEEDRILKQPTEELSYVTPATRQDNDLDAVGVFVTSALKGMKNRSLVLRAKRQIFDVILNMQEEELRLSEL